VCLTGAGLDDDYGDDYGDEYGDDDNDDDDADDGDTISYNKVFYLIRIGFNTPGRRFPP